MKIIKIFSTSFLALFLFAFSALAYSGTIDNGIETGSGGSAQTASSPSASPSAGTYTSAQSVSLSASSANSIRYTVNGDTPSCTSGSVYSSAINIGSSQTVKAIACYLEEGGSTSPSTVASFSYAINIPTPPSSGGGGGGGGASINYCSAVTYTDWGNCINGFQFRQVLTQSPANCSLNTAQQISLQRTCVIDTDKEEGAKPEDKPEVKDPKPEASDLDVSLVMNKERELVKKKNTALTNRLSGRILLQVEGNGEAWYVEPTTKTKHFMGRPVDAFEMMRRFGLGISEANFSKFEKSGVPSRFAGRILLRVENKGEAYYINPVDLKMYYLGRPDDAFRIMRELALGISNDNLRQIPVGEVK